MRKRLMHAAAVLALALVWSSPASSMTVFDPSNYAQNILQASRALEQIHNQIQSIEQQAHMLAQNPLQLSPELAQSVAQAKSLFANAQGLAFEVDTLSAQVRTLYPETWANFNLGDVGARTSQWLSQDRAAVERTMQAEAQSAQALAATQGHIDQALSSSSAAEGQTSAVQASNQLLGIQAAQLAQIQALLVAQSRALSEERMQRLSREQRAAEIMRQAFPSQSSASLTPARSAFGGN